MSHSNELAEQMGVGDGDEIVSGCACGLRWCDGSCPEACDDSETPEPCRGCGRLDCDSECAAFREWLTVAWLAVDTAERGGARGSGMCECGHWQQLHVLFFGACEECRCSQARAAHGGDADAR